MEGNKCISRISACALGVAFGVTSAIFVLVFSLLSLKYGWGADWVKVMSSVYVGFGLTAKGIAVGVLWAFVDGYIFGLLIGWIYNLVLKLCRCKTCHPELRDQPKVDDDKRITI